MRTRTAIMPIAQAVGLGAAVDYLSELDLVAVRAHEQDLLKRALQELARSTDCGSWVRPSPPAVAARFRSRSKASTRTT